jgi:hypothetical protein
VTDTRRTVADVAVYLSAGLVIAAGILAVITLGREGSTGRAEHDPA